MTTIHANIDEIVQAKVAPVVAERIMRDVLLARTEAELMRAKHAAGTWRARCIALAALAGLGFATCTAQWVYAEGNHNGGDGTHGAGASRNTFGGPNGNYDPSVSHYDFRQNWSVIEQLVDRYFGPNQPVPSSHRSEPDHSDYHYGGGQAAKAGF
jgi:hypothetical protein